jgi:hypothetical protein
VKRCSNCLGAHSASYGGCPEKKRFNNILQLSVIQNIPVAEAKKQLPKPSFADVLKATPKTSPPPNQVTQDSPKPIPKKTQSRPKKSQVNVSYNVKPVISDHTYVQPSPSPVTSSSPLKVSLDSITSQVNLQTIIQFFIELLITLLNSKDSSQLLNVALNLASKHFNFNLQTDLKNLQASSSQ